MATSFDCWAHAEGKLLGESEDFMFTDPLEIPIAYESSSSKYPYTPGFNYFSQKIRYSLGESEAEFRVCHYFAMRARYQGKEFLLDGRNAPFDSLWQGEYLNDERPVPVTEIVFIRKDLKTGEVQETLRTESVPGIVHDLEKEFGPEIKKHRAE